jgi:hypothetical protein
LSTKTTGAAYTASATDAARTASTALHVVTYELGLAAALGELAANVAADQTAVAFVILKACRADTTGTGSQSERGKESE